MKKISNNNTFANYIGKFIDVNIEGTIHKFLVSEIDAGSITTNAGILYPDTFSILRESPDQQCDICDDPCVNSVPIIELNFSGGSSMYFGTGIGVINFTNGKLSEIYDFYLNGNKICRIDTNTLSADINRLWLIPFHSSNVQTPNILYDKVFDFSPPYTTAVSCVFFNPSFYNNRDWNTYTINPVSAYNPYPYNPAADNIPQTFYTTFGLSRVLTNKILVNSNNVSSVSCIAWNQDDLNFQQNYGASYLSTDLVPGSFDQVASAFFINLDPCQNPTEYSLGFNYDADRYYTSTSTETSSKYAYTSVNYFPDPYYRAPILQKYIFYTDCSKTTTMDLYYGFSYSNTYGGYRYFTDLGITPFSGAFYAVTNVDLYPPAGIVARYNVVNGAVTNLGSPIYCP